MNWPMVVLASVAIAAITLVALFDRDVAAVSGVILTLLIALGLGELREIKTNTNGNNNQLIEQNKALMAEIAEYRRNAASITNRALESPALPPLPRDPTE